MWQFTKVCFILLMTLFFTATVFAKEPIRTVEGTVIAVSDGDTLRLETSEGTKLRVRLYGIDAPETERISRRTGVVTRPGQPFGEEAHEALKSKVLKKNVKVDIMAIDRHRRMIGMVYLDGRNINLEMVEGGWAWAYRRYLDGPYTSEFIEAEKEARTKRLGLWQQANPQPPWEFRRGVRIRGN